MYYLVKGNIGINKQINQNCILQLTYKYAKIDKNVL